MSNVRVIAISIVTVLVVLLLFYANGSLGRFLCQHFHDGWLEQHGYLMCRRLP